MEILIQIWGLTVWQAAKMRNHIRQMLSGEDFISKIVISAASAGSSDAQSFIGVLAPHLVVFDSQEMRAIKIVNLLRRELGMPVALVPGVRFYPSNARICAGCQISRHECDSLEGAPAGQESCKCPICSCQKR